MINDNQHKFNSSEDEQNCKEDARWMLSAYIFDELSFEEKQQIEELIETDESAKSEYELIKKSNELIGNLELLEPSTELSEETLKKIMAKSQNRWKFQLPKIGLGTKNLVSKPIFAFATAASILLVCMILIIGSSLKNSGNPKANIAIADKIENKSFRIPTKEKSFCKNFPPSPSNFCKSATYGGGKAPENLADAAKKPTQLDKKTLQKNSLSKMKWENSGQIKYNPAMAAIPETAEPVNPIGIAQAEIEGTVLYKFPTGGWKNLENGMHLAYLNCQLMVEKNSKLTLDFGDIQLNARGGVLSSTINLVQDPLNSDAAMIEMLENSQVYIENQSQDNNITLRAPRSYVQIQKSTKVETKINPNKDTIISVSEGNVLLAAFKDKGIVRKIIRTGETTLINMLGEPEVRKNLNVNWVGNWAKTAVSLQDLTVEKPLDAGDTTSLYEGAVGTLIANDPEINDVPFIITDLIVDAKIDDQVAVTVVDQKFMNTSNRTLEGIFFFPLPEKAAISGFSMWVNGKEIQGEFVERKEARRIYDEYKYRRQDPALLEWAGGNRFKMSVFPIMPGEEKRIKITYTQILESQAGTVKYVYPLISDMLRNNPLKHFKISANVTSAAEISDVTSESHLCSFASEENKSFTTTLEAMNYTPGRDFIVKYELKKDAAKFYNRVYKIEGEKGYIAGFFTPEFETEKKQRDSGKFMFMVDTSGSFNNELYEMQLGVLEELINGLGEDDLFNVLIYDYDSKLLMNQYVEPTEENRKVVLAKLNTLVRLGSTNLRKAFKRCWENIDTNEPTTIILLGDGISTQGEIRSMYLAREISEMKIGRSNLTVAQANANVRIFPIALGNTFDKKMLETLARKFQARVINATRDKNPTTVAKELHDLLNSPMLKNVEIKIDGAEVGNIYPQNFPALINGQQISFVTEYANVENPVKVVISGEINGELVKWEYLVELPENAADNFSIGRYWAKLAIDDLQLRIDAGHPDSDRFAADIVDMSKKFSIASQHTSLLVLENDEEFNTWRIQQTQKAKEQLKLAKDEPYLEIVRTQLGDGARSNFKVRAKDGDSWVDLKTLGNKIPVDSVISVPFDSELDVKVGSKVLSLTEKSVVTGTDIPEASELYQTWLEKQGEKPEIVEVAPTPEEFNDSAKKLYKRIQQELLNQTELENDRLRRIYKNDLTNALRAINFFEKTVSSQLKVEKDKLAIKEQAEKFREIIVKTDDVLFVQEYFKNYLPKKSLKPVVKFSDKISLNSLNHRTLIDLARMRTGLGFFGYGSGSGKEIEMRIRGGSSSGQSSSFGGFANRTERDSGADDEPPAPATPADEAPEENAPGQDPEDAPDEAPRLADDDDDESRDDDDFSEDSGDDDDDDDEMLEDDEDGHEGHSDNSDSNNAAPRREEMRNTPETTTNPERPRPSVAPRSNNSDDPITEPRDPNRDIPDSVENPRPQGSPENRPEPELNEAEKSKDSKKENKKQEAKKLTLAEQLQALISEYKKLAAMLENPETKKSFERAIQGIKQQLLKMTVNQLKSTSLLPERVEPYLISQIIAEYTKFMLQQIKIIVQGENSILVLTENGAISQAFTESRKKPVDEEPSETPDENSENDDDSGEKIDEQQKTDYLPIPKNGTVVFALDCSYTMGEQLTKKQINALDYPTEIKAQIKTKFDIARLELINGLSNLKNGENYAIILFNRNFSFIANGRIMPMIQERRTSDNIRELFESFAGARRSSDIMAKTMLSDAITVIKPDDVSNLPGLLKRLYSQDLFPAKNASYLGKTVYIISDGHVSWSDDSTEYLKNGTGNGETVMEPLKNMINADFWKLQEEWALRIHTVGVGNHNAEILRKIADSTGGKYLDTTGEHNSGFRTAEETLEHRFVRTLAELKKKAKNFDAWDEFTKWASSSLVNNDDFAMQAFIAWASGDSGNHIIYEKMGEWLEKTTGNANSAIRAFSTLIEINSTDPDAHRFLGNFYRARSMFEEAIVEYETARNLAWHIVIAYFNEADAAQNVGDYQHAIHLLTEIVEKKGQWSRRYNNIVQRACRSLAVLYQQLAVESKKKEEPEKAKEYLLEAKRWADYRGVSTDLRFIDADVIIILDWDTDGTDVDLWLTYNGNKAKKCFYSNPAQSWGARLHEDQTEGFGPEYITVPKAKEGKYLVQVHYYSNHGFNYRSYCHIKVIFNVGKENQIVQEYHKKLEKGGDAENIVEFKFPLEDGE